MKELCFRAPISTSDSAYCIMSMRENVCAVRLQRHPASACATATCTQTPPPGQFLRTGNCQIVSVHSFDSQTLAIFIGMSVRRHGENLMLQNDPIAGCHWSGTAMNDEWSNKTITSTRLHSSLTPSYATTLHCPCPKKKTGASSRPTGTLFVHHDHFHQRQLPKESLKSTSTTPSQRRP